MSAECEAKSVTSTPPPSFFRDILYERPLNNTQWWKEGSLIYAICNVILIELDNSINNVAQIKLSVPIQVVTSDFLQSNSTTIIVFFEIEFTDVHTIAH